jgi:hypothetical protein
LCGGWESYCADTAVGGGVRAGLSRSRPAQPLTPSPGTIGGRRRAAVKSPNRVSRRRFLLQPACSGVVARLLPQTTRAPLAKAKAKAVIWGRGMHLGELTPRKQLHPMIWGGSDRIYAQGWRSRDSGSHPWYPTKGRIDRHASLVRPPGALADLVAWWLGRRVHPGSE